MDILGEEEFVISSIELENTLDLLKRNKASDPFNIAAEHIIFAQNDRIKVWLLDFFNQIINEGDVPTLLASSKMIPLAKSLKLPWNKCNPDSH